MKIAVATSDGAAMSQHFGRSAGFVVFDVDGTTIKGRELRTNNHTPHAQGLCNHGGEHQHQGHSHAGILDLLGDCQIVLCGGMGAGAVQALKQHGIKAFVVEAGSVDDAIATYLQAPGCGTQAGFCACRH